MTTQEICDALAGNQLLGESELATLRGQWFKPNRQDADDPAKFQRWLVANRYTTDFVIQAVMAGKASQLVFHQYRVQSRLNSGPMAGALLAVDPDDRKVAIEVIAPDTDQKTSLGILQAITRLIKVKHPNVGGALEINEADGRPYVVKEYYEGDTLASILARRDKLPHVAAARLFTLAFAGLQALHDHMVPGGDLDSECLLLAQTAQGAKGKRTVKILHAGVKRTRFDNTVLEAAGPEAVKGDIKFQTTFGLTPSDKVVPERDLFRLGCAFYQAVTGTPPYEQHELIQPTRRATPVRQLAPQVPGMLAEIIEELIDPNLAKRPKMASHVGKALRVFLASDEDDLVQPEENIAMSEKAEVVETEVYVVEEPKAPKARPKMEVAEDRPRGSDQLFPPTPRDLVFLGSGIASILVLLVLLHLVTAWTLASLACLMAGFAGSFLVDRLLVYFRPARQRLTSRVH